MQGSGGKLVRDVFRRKAEGANTHKKEIYKHEHNITREIKESNNGGIKTWEYVKYQRGKCEGKKFMKDNYVVRMVWH